MRLIIMVFRDQNPVKEQNLQVKLLRSSTGKNLHQKCKEREKKILRLALRMCKERYTRTDYRSKLEKQS